MLVLLEYKTVVISGGYEQDIDGKFLDWKQSNLKHFEEFSSIKLFGFHKITIPQLLQHSYSHTMFLTNANEILVCGRKQFKVIKSEWGLQRWKDFSCEMISNQECLKLENGQWVHHSKLNQSIQYCTAITMPNGVYIFGGEVQNTTPQDVQGEFLANGSTKWEIGPSFLHLDNPFLRRLCRFSGLRISEEDFVLIGIGQMQNCVVKYNIRQKEWKIVVKMKISRYGHTSALVNNKIIICGGLLFQSVEFQAAKTEIIYLTSWTSKVIENEENVFNVDLQTCGFITFRNQEKLVLFGKPCKMWNDTKEEWENIDHELRMPRSECGILSLPSTVLF